MQTHVRLYIPVIETSQSCFLLVSRSPLFKSPTAASGFHSKRVKFLLLVHQISKASYMESPTFTNYNDNTLIMVNKKESERHKLLKEYAKLLLSKSFGVPKEHIYEEFTIGSTKFDVIAYPPVELKNVKIIGVECGNKKSNIPDNYNHFRNALKFVDLIFWIPYSIYYAPYIDLIHSRIKDIVFIQMSFDISDKNFSEISNTAIKDKMYALFISKKGRFPKIEVDVKEFLLYEWQFKKVRL